MPERLKNKISAIILIIGAIDAAACFLFQQPAILCVIVVITAALGLLLARRIASPVPPPGASAGESPEAAKLALLNETIATVRHDINNPLMIITGNAQILEIMMTDSPDDQMERVRSILHETERIGQITKRLRDQKQPAESGENEPV